MFGEIYSVEFKLRNLLDHEHKQIYTGTDIDKYYVTKTDININEDTHICKDTDSAKDTELNTDVKKDVNTDMNTEVNTT